MPFDMSSAGTSQGLIMAAGLHVCKATKRALLESGLAKKTLRVKNVYTKEQGEIPGPQS